MEGGNVNEFCFGYSILILVAKVNDLLFFYKFDNESSYQQERISKANIFWVHFR